MPKSKEDHKEKRWKPIVEWLTLVLLIVATIAACIQSWLMREALHTDSQAYINASLNLPPDVKEAEPIVGSVEFVNTGKTPARRVKAKIMLQIVKNGNRPVLTFDPQGLPFVNDELGLLVPNEKETIPAPYFSIGQDIAGRDQTGIPITREESELLLNGDAYLAGFGSIEFEDIFGIKHETRFCFWKAYARAARKYTAYQCMKYNDFN